MTGARVTYTFEDGTTLVKGGSFDLAQVNRVREKVERRHGKRVIATEAAWRLKPVQVEDVCPGCGFVGGIHWQYCGPHLEYVAGLSVNK